MIARLRNKNERMRLDLLDQIKNLPTDLSSDEFDSLQVNFSKIFADFFSPHVTFFLEIGLEFIYYRLKR